MVNNIKLLFVLRQRSVYGVSFGLLNSCRLLAKALFAYNVTCKIVEVIDSNFIDKEVHNYNPDFVVIEALWCESSKLPILFKLHPTVKKWTVRCHSRTPFLANEGFALTLLKAYAAIMSQYSIFSISGNHSELINELKHSLNVIGIYLPNIYPFENKDSIHISSFGAIRPQKNHLIQAMAAIGFANSLHKTLHFHINSDRNEIGGENILRNLRSLFGGLKHQLIEHPWMEHDKLIELVKQMDISMAVSNSETCCLTILDSVVNDIPVITSDVVDIISSKYHADPNKIDSIIDKLKLVWEENYSKKDMVNQNNLQNYNKVAIRYWLDWLRIKKN